MRRIQIIDLDGCIADDRHRRKHIDPALAQNRHPSVLEARDAMWDRYHKECFLDPLANIDKIVERQVVVLTGRPLRHYEATRMWLTEVAYISPLYIIMRNNQDHSPSVDLKRRMVYGLLDANSYGVHRDELVLAIDDRSDVVEMYKAEFDLNAHIVRIGDEHEHG